MRLTENYLERKVHGANKIFEEYWYRVLATSYAIDYAFVTNEVLQNASAHRRFDYEEFYASMFSRFAIHYTDSNGVYLFGTVANVSDFCLHCKQVRSLQIGKPKNTNFFWMDGHESHLDSLVNQDIDVEFTEKCLNGIFNWGVLYDSVSFDYIMKVNKAMFDWNLFFNFRETLDENGIGFLQECEDEFQRILPAAEVFYDKIYEANYKMNI